MRFGDPFQLLDPPAELAVGSLDYYEWCFARLREDLPEGLTRSRSIWRLVASVGCPKTMGVLLNHVPDPDLANHALHWSIPRTRPILSAWIQAHAIEQATGTADGEGANRRL